MAQPEFAGASRLCGFLRFVVEEELGGRGAELKEYVIGVQAYHKSETYDPRTDPTVRVDAGKLRARLTEYYKTGGRNDPIVISIPKGTFLPRFEMQAPARTPEPAVQPVWSRRTPLRWVLGLLVLAIAGAGLVSRRTAADPGRLEPAPAILSLSSYPGEQSSPSLSPDGSMVAFTWNGEAQDNFDIYIKVVDAPNAVRLTTNPARDVAPAWSPDGQQIAFLRNPGPSGEVYIVSALGGPERRVATFNAASVGTSVGWTRDSRNLLVMHRNSPNDPHAGFILPLDTGEPRQLTFPPRASIVGDYDLVASPDGRFIAFCRMVHAPVAELWLLPADGGDPVKLTESRHYIRGLSWTPDSRKIVFSSQQSGFSALWIVKAEPGSAPSLLPGLETDAVRPSIAARAGSIDRIAYQRRSQPYHLWHAHLSAGRMSPPRCIDPSQRSDFFPQISPDGKRIAFSSDRAGRFDIWVSRLDGAGLTNLTAGSGLDGGSPQWSPDGTTIAFDAHGETSNYATYTTPAAGGPVHRVTPDGSEAVRPSWSANGKWIYFTSDRTGRREIWRVPAKGGPATQMTVSGGFGAFESPDGSVLYFLESAHLGRLWRMPSVGGSPSLVHEGIREGRWAVAKAGIYFIDASRRVCLLQESTQVLCVGEIERDGPEPGGIGLSPDGADIVYAQPEPVRSDLRMAKGKLFQ